MQCKFYKCTNEAEFTVTLKAYWYVNADNTVVNTCEDCKEYLRSTGDVIKVERIQNNHE